jgi:uncharacterized protein (DUF305 family)
MTRTRRVLALTATVLVTAVGLGGCGSESETPSTTPTTPIAQHSGGPVAGPHNDLDVEYASSMFTHARQAVELATMAQSKSRDEKVKALAARIQTQQSPYMATLGGWLSGWGSQAPGLGGEQSEHADHDGHLSDTEITKLGGLSTARFDQQWAKTMIKHHQGAITMSKKIQEMGANPEVKKFAQQIVTTEEAEIEELRAIR